MIGTKVRNTQSGERGTLLAWKRHAAVILKRDGSRVWIPSEEFAAVWTVLDSERKREAA